MNIVHFAPFDVAIWALSGGLVYVLSRLPADGMTGRWLTNAIVHLIVRTLVGIAGSAFGPAMMIAFGMMSAHTPTSVPGWAVAFAVASSEFMFGRSGCTQVPRIVATRDKCHTQTRRVVT